MSNVKTFFKTLLWTLVVLIVLVGGFWAYMRFFNQDLAKSFTALVYKTEATECPVCEKCEVCEPKDTNSNEEFTGMSTINFDKEFERLNNKLNDALDMLDTLDEKNSDANMDEYGVVEEPAATTEKTKDEIIDDLTKRIEKLENK